ncbi:MAG: hypothetical protein EXR08_11970 [Alphaproteobacteria bacterium]|nr:hypothetical protein [Alphaproteobacteria bacterium]
MFLENVRIPGNGMVGQEGDGWKAALTVLMNERVVTGHIAGIAGAGELIALARGAMAGDAPALHNAAIREKIADWHVQEQGLKYIHYRSLTALSRGGVPGPENSVAKVVNAALGQDLSAFAMELMDAGGIMHEPGLSSQQTDFQADWISSPGMRLAGGADDILRNIIAEQVLGLPGDVRIDKDIPFNAMPRNK